MQGDEELTAPSVCVIAAGGLTPDLSEQTLQDYQVLCVKTESEALARSGADAFLWLTSTGKLAPRALEECLWALQSADWATWEDTGADDSHFRVELEDRLFADGGGPLRI